MANVTKEEILNSNLEEEASVLEIQNELQRRISDEDAGALNSWLKSQLVMALEAGRIGFYIDEFGARDIREIDAEEALTVLDSAEIWSAHSDTMLHAYLQD